MVAAVVAAWVEAEVAYSIQVVAVATAWAQMEEAHNVLLTEVTTDRLMGEVSNHRTGSGMITIFQAATRVAMTLATGTITGQISTAEMTTAETIKRIATIQEIATTKV